MHAVERLIENLKEITNRRTARFNEEGVRSSRHSSNLNTPRQRFTKYCLTATLMCVVVLLLSHFGFAQRVVTAYASIPFDFWVQGHEFQAGEYVFDSGFPGSTTVRRKGSNSSFAISIIPYADPVKKESARVLFVRRDGKYYLIEFWGILDKRVVTAEFEDRGQAREQQREVSLTYP